MKVIQIIPNLALAGAETMCATLSCELIKMGVDVIIISLYKHHSSLTDRLERKGIRIIYLDKKRGPDLRIMYRLYKVFKEERPDVVHTHLYVTPYAIPSAILTGVKIRIHTVHNIASKESRPMLQIINRLFYKYNNMIPVALSEEIQKTIQELYNLSLKKIPIIYNGIDIDCCTLKSEYSQNGKLRYIHVGRFSEQKNHMMLIDAFSILHAKIPGTELVLVGEGELQNQIIDRVHELNLQDCVILYGKSDNVFPLLNSADVFILPSKYEGVPISIIEAMGTGLPIIATKVGGVPDMLENEINAILTEVDIESIVDAMMRMTDIGLRERLGKSARIRADKMFSAPKMAQEYYKLYIEGSINSNVVKGIEMVTV